MDRTLKYAWIALVGVFVALPVLGILTREAGQVEQQHTDMMRREPQHEDTIAMIDDSVMVVIPAGPFVQGNNAGAYDEQPATPVVLDTFSIDKYEVTNRRYFAFVKQTGHRAPASRYGGMEAFQRPELPVVYVSWDDAAALCQWEQKRLPTEAEWEKAAKGTRSVGWPWGDDERVGAANVKGEHDGVKYTARIGSFEDDRSMYGVVDMGGNVREWVDDWYDQHAYRRRASEEGIEPEPPTTRVLRGGSWADSIVTARTSARFKMLPRYRDTAIGFRCATDGVPE